MSGLDSPDSALFTMFSLFILTLGFPASAPTLNGIVVVGVGVDGENCVAVEKSVLGCANSFFFTGDTFELNSSKVPKLYSFPTPS